MQKENVKKKLAETLSPQKLAREQFEYYKAYCQRILHDASNYLEDLDEDGLQELTSHSPSGDGNGMDNDFLNFGLFRPLDILEAMDLLINLYDIANGDKDPGDFDPSEY